MRGINNISTRVSGKVLSESEKLEKEFRARITGYIFAAFGLVAGLAWNDAIKALIEYLFPLDQSTVRLKFLYAFTVTAILVVVTIYASKFFKDNK
ncbi:DUF5654 family protein [Patescibacteria group bacterium]